MRRSWKTWLCCGSIAALVAILIEMAVNGVRPIPTALFWLILMVPALLGMTKAISILFEEECQACGGQGYKPNVALMILDPCPVCQPAEEHDPAAKVGPRSRRSPLAERLEAV
jgi:hypothetical protein